MKAYKAWDKYNSEGYGTVGFSANRSEFASCVCDACHATTFVTILTMPETKVQADGTLRTIYKKTLAVRQLPRPPLRRAGPGSDDERALIGSAVRREDRKKKSLSKNKRR